MSSEMDSPTSVTGSAKRHSRNTSRPMVRRNTKGPLDPLDDPLAAPVQVGSPIGNPDQASDTSISPSPPPSSSKPITAPIPKPATDIRFLQNPNLYQAISTEEVPVAFLDPTRQPPDETSLAALLQAGFFRRAANVAVKLLLTAPDNVEHVLHLLYTRLACLVLISKADIAVQEANPLIDLLGRNPVGAKDLISRIPWELKLLLVHLQSIGLPEGGRRCVMSLYGLANEARTRIASARLTGHDSEAEIWTLRLRDIGLRVSDTLVEMGELETARRHLNSLSSDDPRSSASGADAPPGALSSSSAMGLTGAPLGSPSSGARSGELAYRKALLLIRVGDILGAQQYVDQIPGSGIKNTLIALLAVANGESSSAADAWKALADQEPENALAVNNGAVNSLYLGRIVAALEGFESGLKAHPPFSGLLFNLSTVFELCTERALERKNDLVQQMATRDLGPHCGGAERTMLEFKL